MIVSVCNPIQGLASLPPEMKKKKCKRRLLLHSDAQQRLLLHSDAQQRLLSHSDVQQRLLLHSDARQTLEMVGGIVARQLVHLYCSSTECAIFHKTLKLS